MQKRLRQERGIPSFDGRDSCLPIFMGLVKGSKYAHWLLERGEDETSETLLTLNNQSWVRETNAYNHWPFFGESISFS